MNAPLWMPEGSVRALIAISITAAAIFMWVTERDMTEVQALVTTGVAGGYFALRQIASGVSLPNGKPQQNLLEGTDG